MRYLTLDRFSSAHRWDTTELHGQKTRLHEGREPIQSAGLGCWETRRRGCARSTNVVPMFLFPKAGYDDFALRTMTRTSFSNSRTTPPFDGLLRNSKLEEP